MGEHELQEALRSRAQERIDAAWQAAEAEVAARRAEAVARREALLDAWQQKLVTVAAAERRAVLTAVELAVRREWLTAVAALVERLHALAAGLLPDLGGAARHRLWRALAAELPGAEWQRVRVSPDDLELARQTYPAATVEGDPALTGGLVAETADGRIVVDNSLSGRLELAWPGLLTPLLAAIVQEVDRDAAGPAPAG